jgi:predicted enzyme related to lactoylglutathione lyase
MSQPTPATFVEIHAKDPSKAKAFFGELLGWSFEEVPMAEGGSYTFAKPASDAPPVAGLTSDGTSFALVYFVVPDLKKATERARKLGATIHVDQHVIQGMGSMTVLDDPQGAKIALWQAASPAKS